MNLEKIDSGTQVSLKIKKENTIATFDTEIIDHVGNCLVCRPMLQDEKLINFAIPGITQEIQIFDNEHGKMYAWRNIEIKAGYYRKTTLCHLIYLNSVPVEINRRNNYRQVVGVEGKAIPFHRPPSAVYLKDVSNSGICFIVKERQHFEVGRKLKITFSDCEGRFVFDLDCEIVRERELENGNLEFGCAISNPPQLLANYIAHKQLLERKRVLGML